ncbi:MAG: hypothetical protein R3C05_16520 [Pirellulaceae bacterium]
MSEGLNLGSNPYVRDHAEGLAGLNESPQINTSAGGDETGAGILYDEATNVLTFRFAYGSDSGFGDLESDFGMAHIHGGGLVTVSG